MCEAFWHTCLFLKGGKKIEIVFLLLVYNYSNMNNTYTIRSTTVLLGASMFTVGCVVVPLRSILSVATFLVSPIPISVEYITTGHIHKSARAINAICNIDQYALSAIYGMEPNPVIIL